MLLFKEVYGWTRYLISKDPICRSQGVVVEEIYSTFAPFSDSNDGVRTLVIHRAQDGLTPRLEYRAIGLHPQIYWYAPKAVDGELLAVTNQFGFTGDYKSWDCSDVCQWLLAATHTRLCSAAEVEVTISASCPVTAKKILDLPIVKRILDAAKRSSEKGTRLTRAMVNLWLKENEKADLWDFALSVINWFDKGKVDWKEIDYLENTYAPGIDLVDWSWIQRQLDTPERLGKLPPPIVDRIKEDKETKGHVLPAHLVKSRFDSMLLAYSKGSQVKPILATNTVQFGQSSIEHFKAGNIPYQYLQQLSISDPYETVLPWSFIKRSVLSYTRKKIVESKADEISPIPQLILEWLNESHLLLLLYKGDPQQQEALSKAIEAQIQYHITQTLDNDYWLRSVLTGLAGLDSKTALQTEFDLWLLDALSPAVDRFKLPLSPYAFSVEKKNQDDYDKIFKAWVKQLKEHLKGYKDISGQRLTDAFSKFFCQVTSLWNTEKLKNYKVKIPSASKILDAVEKSSLDDLLGILCEDFEHELGTTMPQEIKDSLLQSPFFHTILHEVKMQGLRLD